MGGPAKHEAVVVPGANHGCWGCEEVVVEHVLGFVAGLK